MAIKKKTNRDDTTFAKYDGFRDTVITAVQYGFTPLKHLAIQNEDKRISVHIDAKDNHEAAAPLRHVNFDTKEKAALLEKAMEAGAQGGQPYMPYFEKSTKDELFCHLDIIGNNKGVAEGIIISTGVAMLKDAGIADPIVSINCVGDKDSSQRFMRALHEYYKKNIDALPATCRTLLKKDIIGVLTCTEHEKCKILAEDAPKSMHFLSEISRTHFKEVLEYLDGSNVNYLLSENLMPTKSYMTQTIFTFQSNDEKKPKIYGFGARYNALSKRIGMKRELSAAGACIAIPEEVLTAKEKHKMEKPKFFFIHVGTEARFKSLAIVEMLREAKINLAHAIIRDKLSSQLMQAEGSGMPFTILMGQKECVEHSVIVRNNINRSQNTIKLEGLIEYLKKLK